MNLEIIGGAQVDPPGILAAVLALIVFENVVLAGNDAHVTDPLVVGHGETVLRS